MFTLQGDAGKDDEVHIVRDNGQIVGRFLWLSDHVWYFAPAEGVLFTRDNHSDLSTLFYNVVAARRTAIRAEVSKTSASLMRQMRAAKPLGDADDVLG